MPTYVFLAVIVSHFVADFPLQSHKMALGKSSSNKWLGAHVAVYGLAITATLGSLVYWLTGSGTAVFIWVSLNAALHFVTDYYTSRWTKRLREADRWHDFFVVVGFDQLIHIATLTVTLDWFV